MTTQSLIGRLENVKPCGEGFTAKCPAHGDEHNSLSVSTGSDGRILLNCHAGCRTEDIVAALGLEMKDLFTRDAAPKRPNKAEYLYTDANGELVAKKIRGVDEKGKKSFYWKNLDANGNWVKGKGPAQALLYNIGAMQDDMLFLVEGEKDVDTLKRLGPSAVSLPDGCSSRWHPDYDALFKGKTVYIIPDNDRPGRDYATRLASKLYDLADSVTVLDLATVWSGIPDKADITDYCEEFGPETTVETIAKMCRESKPWTPEDSATERFSAKAASQFGEDNTSFLWHPYVPIGDYTVLMAEGGTGKTLFCCGLAAAVSRGEKLPGDESCKAPEPGNVLIISAEDRGELLKKRLAACGADLSKVYIIDCMASVGLNFGDEGEVFCSTVQRYKPKLIIIDPWHAFLGASTNINMVNAVRPVLQRLANIAKTCESGLILISHVNKRSQSENANNAATGSTDLINAARSALKIIYSNEVGKENVRIVVHTKSNYAKLGDSVEYRITSDSGIRWNGLSGINRSVIEEAAKYRKTPEEVLRSREKTEAVNDELIEAIRGCAELGKSIGFTYEEFRQEYGDAIFGDSNQYKRSLERVSPVLEREGITLTFKHIKRDGKSQNGFSITKKLVEMKNEQDPWTAEIE